MSWIYGVSFKFISEVTCISLRLNQMHPYLELNFRQARSSQNKAGKCSSGLEADKTFVIPYLAKELSVGFTWLISMVTYFRFEVLSDKCRAKPYLLSAVCFKLWIIDKKRSLKM